MKKKYTLISFSAFLFFAGLTSIKAQETPFLQFGEKQSKKDTVPVKKVSMCSKITKTPWVIQFGPDIVDDNGARLSEFKMFDTRNFFPIHCSAEKRGKKGLGIQAVFSSETLNPHSFASIDLNAKYSLMKKQLNDAKWFDPYAVLGAGFTYRDYPHGSDTKTGYNDSYSANLGGGVNIWFFKNAGIYAQALAKFNMYQTDKMGGGNYIQFSAGVVFKIGGENAAEVTVAETKVNPASTYKRSKEAEDAAQYLRDILNK